MGLFTKDVKTMDDLFLHMMQDIYYAEHKIHGALPHMIEKASNSELVEAFKAHRLETEIHIERLVRAFEMLGQEPKGINCPAIDGIIKEANEIVGEIADKQVLDAALIAAAQAVEHYEITRYGTLIAWAQQAGRDAVAQTLKATLEEEKRADKMLTMMAERRINLRAAS